MRTILNARAMFLDRSVLLLIVSLNLTVLSKLKLTSETLMGAFNGSLAGSLLVASLWRPASYAQCRTVPIVLLRLLVCALPLVHDTVKPFAKGFDLGEQASDHPLAWQLGRAIFMLLVGISWAVGMFLATFLLLPPAQHLAVQAASLAMLLTNNKTVCQQFLRQTPSNATIIEAIDAVLRAGVMSVVPATSQEMGVLGGVASHQAICMAGATAMQVSLGFVLPTLLAWQLQSGMAASIAAYAQARQDSAMVAQVQRSHCTTLCGAVASATQGFPAKLLVTLGSMLVTYTAVMLVLVSPPSGASQNDAPLA